VGAALALSTAGLIALTMGSASATTITETFGGSGPTGPLELQISETINASVASVTQGGPVTFTVPGGSQVVPTSQSGVSVVNISGLQQLIPVPSNTTFTAGSIVTGSWSFTPVSGPVVTGPYTVTECTGPVAGTCTATAPNGTTFQGPGTSTPYIEATTGSATFAAGGTLTLPTVSFGVTATGTGTIQTTVSEFDTSATVLIGTTQLTVAIAGYPAAVVPGCITTGGTCTQAPYMFQPISSTVINSPPQAPVLAPQTGAVSAGQCTTINPLNGATEVSDTPNPASVLVSTPPAHGTATPNATTGIITYCNTSTAATDTFQVTAAGTTSGLRSTPVTETINISTNSCSAGAGNPAGGSTGALSSCSLHQEIVLPVTPGQIVLSQSIGVPVDFLGSSLCTGGTVPGITLNGNAQNACGAVSPLTITNATGLDTGWTLTGQVTDFNDPAAPTLTCDTPATYNNHCIPGDNLAWQPAAAVSHTIVPGDVAQVTAGPIVLPPNPQPPVVNANPVLQGALTQANPVVEPSPTVGLHSAMQMLCSTNAGQAGGTFICGAGLELAVPASAAEPTLGSFGAPAYQANLTLTLS
jgi:hypothetical protein